MSDGHMHSKTCTFEVCGTGPTREELVRATLLRRLGRNEEFLHYKRSEVEAMFASSALDSPLHNAPRKGSSGSSAVDPGESTAVRASAPQLAEAVPIPTTSDQARAHGVGRSRAPASPDVAP